MRLMGHNRDALVKKQSSWKLDIKFIALITEAKRLTQWNYGSIFIKKSVVIRIAGLLEIEGVFEQGKLLLIINR